MQHGSPEPISAADLESGTAVLRSLDISALLRMQRGLRAAVQVGHAGAATWAALGMIRVELRARGGEDADGTSGE